MEIEDDFNNINEDDSNQNSKEQDINKNNSFISTGKDTGCNFASLLNFYENKSKNNVKIENNSSNILKVIIV